MIYNLATLFLFLVYLAVPVLAQSTKSVSFYLIGGIGSSLNTDSNDKTYNEKASVYYKYSDDSTWSFVNTFTLEKNDYTQVSFDAVDSTGNLTIKVVSSNTGLIPNTNSQRYIFMNDNQFTIGSYSVLNYTMYLSCSVCSASEKYNRLNGFFYEDTEYTITFPSDLSELPTSFVSSAATKLTTNGCSSTSTSTVCFTIQGIQGDSMPTENEKINISVEHLDGSVDTYLTYLLVPTSGTTYSINYNQDPLTNTMTNKGFKKIIISFLNALPVKVKGYTRGVYVRYDPIYLDGEELSTNNLAISGPETATYSIIEDYHIALYSQGDYYIRYTPSAKQLVFILQGKIGSSQDADPDIERTYDEKVGIYYKLLGESDWMYYSIVSLDQGYNHIYLNYPDEGKNLTIKLVVSNTGFIPDTSYFRYVYLNDAQFMVDNLQLLTYIPYLTCTGCSNDESYNRTRGILAENATYTITLPLDSSDYPLTSTPIDANQIDCTDTTASSVCVYLWSDTDGYNDPQTSKVNVSIVHTDDTIETYYSYLNLTKDQTQFAMNPNTDPITGELTGKGFKKLIISLINSYPEEYQSFDRIAYFDFNRFTYNGQVVAQGHFLVDFPYNVWDETVRQNIAYFTVRGDNVITYYSEALPNVNVSFQIRGNLRSSSDTISNEYNERVYLQYRYLGYSSWTEIDSYNLERDSYQTISLSFINISRPIMLQLTTSNYNYDTGSANVPYVYFNENEFKMKDVAVLNISKYLVCDGCDSGQETYTSRGIFLSQANYIFTLPVSTDSLSQPYQPVGLDSIDCSSSEQDTVCFTLTGAMGSGEDRERVSISVTHSDGSTTVYYYCLSLLTTATTIKLAYNMDPVTGEVTNKGFRSFSINFFNKFTAITSPYDRSINLDYSSLTMDGSVVPLSGRIIATTPDDDLAVMQGIDGLLNSYGVYTIILWPQDFREVTFLLRGNVGSQFNSDTETNNEQVAISYQPHDVSGWIYIGQYSLESTSYSTIQFTYPKFAEGITLQIKTLNAGDLSEYNTDRTVILNDNGFSVDGTVIPHFAPYLSCSACDDDTATSASRGIFRLSTEYKISLPTDLSSIQSGNIVESDATVDCSSLDEDSVCFKMYASTDGLEQAKVNISVIYSDGTKVVHYLHYTVPATSTLIKLNYTSLDDSSNKRIFKKLEIVFVNEMTWTGSWTDRNLFFDYNSFEMNGYSVESKERLTTTPANSDGFTDTNTVASFDSYGVYTITYSPDPCKTTSFVSEGDRLCMYLKSSGDSDTTVSVSYTLKTTNETVVATYTVDGSYSSIPISLDSAMISTIQLRSISADEPVVLNTNGFLLNGDTIDSNNYCISDDFIIYDVFDLSLQS